MEQSLDYKNKPKFASYKEGASTRSLEFKLDEITFNTISNKPCFYCGKEGPNGIDRIDSSKGYLEENCVPACKHCNYVKGNLSLYDFLKWKTRFINYQNNL